MHLRCHPGFTAVGVWILMTVVLANTYAAFLLSFLSVEKFTPVINSISELAYSKDVQLTVQAHSDVAERFLVSPFIYLNVLLFNINLFENIFVTERYKRDRKNAGRFFEIQSDQFNSRH